MVARLVSRGWTAPGLFHSIPKVPSYPTGRVVLTAPTTFCSQFMSRSDPLPAPLVGRAFKDRKILFLGRDDGRRSPAPRQQRGGGGGRRPSPNFPDVVSARRAMSGVDWAVFVSTDDLVGRRDTDPPLQPSYVYTRARPGLWPSCYSSHRERPAGMGHAPRRIDCFNSDAPGLALLLLRTKNSP